MKNILKLEELAITLVAIFILFNHNLGLPAWAWVLLFFAPDISILGYLAGNRAGAFCYNLFHHKGIALAIAMAGYWTNNEIMIASGTLLFAHASFDRIWGYGLKYADSFKNTHLGSLAKTS